LFCSPFKPAQFGTVYHRMIIADLGCLYFFFAYLIAVLMLSLGGFCRAPGDAAYTAKMSLAQSQPILQNARPGAGLRAPMRSMRRVTDINTQGRDGGDQPASPQPLVEMLPPSGAQSPQDALVEADQLFAAKQSQLLGRADREMVELQELEQNVLANRGSHPNEAPSPASHFRVNFDDDAGGQQQNQALLGTPARRQGQMPLTPRMH
jgi:hypothetical protein